MLHLATDVGGTFTDVCVFDEEDGTTRVAKVPTTEDPIDAVFEGTESATKPAPASPRLSSLRPTPWNLRSASTASSRGTPTRSSAATAAAAFRRLCSPGTASSTATGSSSSPRTTSGTWASQRAKSSSTSEREANVEW